MEKKKLLKAAMLRATALAGAFWLLAMCLVTWATAEHTLLQVQNHMGMLIGNPLDRQEIHSSRLPGDMEVCTMGLIPQYYYWLNPGRYLPVMTDPWLGSSISSDSWLWGNWNMIYGLEPAAVYYDGEGEIIGKSESFICFEYGEKEFVNVPTGSGYILLDDSTMALESFGDASPTSAPLMFYMPGAARLRMTGRFQGSRFEPVQVDVRYNGTGVWENLLTLEDTGHEPTVTVYAWNIGGFNYNSRPFRFGGVTYESLTDFLLNFSYDTRTDEEFREQVRRMDNLFDALVFYGGSGSDVYGEYTFDLAVRYSPILYSVLRLWPVYLVSLLLLWIGLLWYRAWLKTRVTAPLEQLFIDLRYGGEIRKTGNILEIFQLQERVAAQRAGARDAKAQLDQLQTSLDYARSAEEKRRRLVSDITHELKTPLAVIHSYAECLMEGVAPEKREQQLSVILEEVRNMDDLVLQMLELSRLEAGKVRLQREQVNLAELTKGMLAKFEPLIKAKGLRICWDGEASFELWADKSRMLQALTNLLSNAVKYTPEKGTVILRIGLREGEVYFSVENTAPPLSAEALEQVWDSFYRGDTARNAPGTGLGLSLVKNIIKLHGGSCFVRNVSYQDGEQLETAVVFGFKIPLNTDIPERSGEEA